MQKGLRILITGSNGQLGSSLKRAAGNYPYFHLTFTDMEELDITRFEAVDAFLKNGSFDAVINCAGYTAVDKAETDEAGAFRLNAYAVGHLAHLSSLLDFFLVHISTDYVFDGQKNIPYSETDQPSALSVYARSKMEGENEVLKKARRAMILRTSWLYSEFGNNFFKTILNKCRNGEKLRVVFDQTGTPTYAGDLAEALLKILPRAMEIKKPEIYHYSNEGVASWYDFARCISIFSGYPAETEPIRTHMLPNRAVRPAYSVMDKSKIKSCFGITIPFWQESLIKLLNSDKI